MTLEDKLAAIDIACATYGYTGEIVNRIHAVFDINPVRFWQFVNGILADLEVLAARPIQCRSLRERRQTRSSRLRSA